MPVRCLLVQPVRTRRKICISLHVYRTPVDFGARNSISIHRARYTFFRPCGPAQQHPPQDLELCQGQRRRYIDVDIIVTHHLPSVLRLLPAIRPHDHVVGLVLWTPRPVLYLLLCDPPVLPVKRGPSWSVLMDFRLVCPTCGFRPPHQLKRHVTEALRARDAGGADGHRQADHDGRE